MQRVCQIPNPALSPYVRGYRDVQCVVEPGAIRQLSFGCTGRMHWVILLENRFQTTFNDGRPLANYDSMLIGQMIRPFTHQLTATVRAITIDFTPTGFYRLWGLPADELTGQTVNTELIFGIDAQTVVDQVRAEPDRADRFARLDAFFLRRLEHSLPGDERIETAVDLLGGQPGQWRVGEVAQRVNCPERTLNRRFTERVGLSPKEYARVQRFLQARSWLENQPTQRRNDLLSRLGYYDQSHFINEFRYFTGKSPLLYGADNQRLLDFMRDR